MDINNYHLLSQTMSLVIYVIQSHPLIPHFTDEKTEAKSET